MRIISPFQDYYDGVQAHGFDDKVVYVRKTVETDIPRPGRTVVAKRPDEDLLPTFHKSRPSLRYIHRTNSLFSHWSEETVPGPETAMLYFCGKAYPFFIAAINNNTGNHVHYSFEGEEFDKIIKQSVSSYGQRDPTPYKDWLANNMGKAIDPALHFHHKSPIVLYIGRKVVVDPMLKQFNIQKIINPYTAFQELDMFMGGVMAENRDPPSPMTDKDKVGSHGMDKWSFRKMPEVKK